MGITYRIKQGLAFFMGIYTAGDDRMARNYLSAGEYKIFRRMARYDRKHCVNIAKDIERHEILCRDKLIKLALLHDVGKNKKIGILKRVRHVIFKDVRELMEHPKIGYELLKGISPDIAKLTLLHHDKESKNPLIEIFQRYDDRY